MKEKQPSVETWFEFVSQASLVPPRNEEAILKTALEATSRRAPLPIVLPVCTAVQTLDQPNDKGQTRELVPLAADNPRLTAFVEELFNFHQQTRKHLGVPLETMLLLADVPEPGDEELFAGDRKTIANQSAQGISRAFANLDQTHNGIFRDSGFKIPKVQRLSEIITQAGQVGLNHQSIMKRIELASFKPNNLAFELFIKHLRMAPDWIDETAFESRLNVEKTWARIRFLLGQAGADAAVLPKIMAFNLRNKFELPCPIMVCATTREAGIEVQMDAITLLIESPKIFPGNIAQPGTIAIFKNTGSWTSPKTEQASRPSI